jgi:hypothetical protein
MDTAMIKPIQIEDYHEHGIFYKHMPVSSLTPVSTLDQSIHQVNLFLKQFGRELHTWPHRARNEAARMMWVNWIYNNLNSEPIRKPILVHQHHNEYIVDCGDTRLMAASLYDANLQVPVLITCRGNHQTRYSAWTKVSSNKQLFDLLGFDPDNGTIIATESDPGENHLFSWLEIGDQTTGHHWLDEDMRVSVLQKHLDQQCNNFAFDVNWIIEKINWYALR